MQRLATKSYPTSSVLWRSLIKSQINFQHCIGRNPKHGCLWKSRFHDNFCWKHWNNWGFVVECCYLICDLNWIWGLLWLPQFFFYFSKADCVSNWKFPDVCSTVQILWVHIIYFQNNFKVSVQFAQIIEFSKCVFVRRRKLDAVFFLSLFVQCSNFVLFKLDIWCLAISNFECWKFLLLLLFAIQNRKGCVTVLVL